MEGLGWLWRCLSFLTIPNRIQISVLCSDIETACATNPLTLDCVCFQVCVKDILIILILISYKLYLQHPSSKCSVCLTQCDFSFYLFCAACLRLCFLKRWVQNNKIRGEKCDCLLNICSFGNWYQQHVYLKKKKKMGANLSKCNSLLIHEKSGWCSFNAECFPILTWYRISPASQFRVSSVGFPFWLCFRFFW